MIRRLLGFGGRRYRVLRRVESEVEAVMLTGILEEAGIPVEVRSRQIPFYGDVLAKATGVWGDLLVPAELFAPAQFVIERYLEEDVIAL